MKLNLSLFQRTDFDPPEPPDEPDFEEYLCPECDSHNLMIYDSFEYDSKGKLRFFERCKCLECDWRGIENDLYYYWKNYAWLNE